MTLWGGRFSEGPADSVFALSRSVQFDWRLAPYDIASSLAHVHALETGSIINAKVAASLRDALIELRKEVLSGKFQPHATDEDVHSALERGLTEKLGEIGGAIRAGRSRNDQVATDLKLYLMDNMLKIGAALVKLQEAFIAQSLEYVDAYAPGFTHIQHAQPISFGQELAKHAVALERDLSRIKDWFSRTNLSPLGSGALAGTSLPINPTESAARLGFDGVVPNSIDAVADRDFALEALSIMAIIGVHLSRIGEEWTLWSSSEFGWASIDDAYATGSSIMPQKKNADVAELARGKAGRFIGNLTALLTTVKGLPFSYNRDLQEDKEVIFSSVENLLLLLPPLTGMVSTTTFHRDVMAKAAPQGFSLATEIADYLVRKGIPFSTAHEAAGGCVKRCETLGVELHQLSDEDLGSIHPELDGAVRGFLNVEGAVNSRNSINGVAPSSVRKQLETLTAHKKEYEKWISHEEKRFSGMMTP
ncbi:MAG: argininosuccinate lyase [Actinobacteria bacterium]|nr:argininosuccinate lyase [Actinomycetota bacterium]